MIDTSHPSIVVVAVATVALTAGGLTPASAAPAAAPGKGPAGAARSQAAAATQPQAVALLDDARKRYSALTALSYTSVARVEAGKTEPQTFSLAATVARPNRVFLRITSPKAADDATTLTGNGTVLYAYNVKSKTFRKNPVSPQNPVQALAQFYALIAAPVLNTSYLFGPASPDESITLGAGASASATLAGEKCRLLIRSRHQTGERVEIWLAQSDGLPRRVRVTITSPEAAGAALLRIEETVSTLTRNPTPAPSVFAFEPPKNAMDAAQLDAQSPMLAAGRLAPDFTLPDQNGKPVTLSKLRGKPVLLLFGEFPGRASGRALEYARSAHEKSGGRTLHVVAVNVMGTLEAQTAFLKTNPRYNALTMVRDGRDDKSVARVAYDVDRLPTLYLIDKDGRVSLALTGFGAPVRDQLSAALAKIGVAAAASSR